MTHLLVQLRDDLHVAAGQLGLLFLQQVLHLALLGRLQSGGRLAALRRRLRVGLLLLQQSLAVHWRAETSGRWTVIDHS